MKFFFFFLIKTSLLIINILECLIIKKKYLIKHILYKYSFKIRAFCLFANNINILSNNNINITNLLTLK